MAFAAGVARVWCGTNGLLSTPATSAVIRMRGGKGYEPFGGRWFDGDGVGDGRGMYQFDMYVWDLFVIGWADCQLTSTS